MNAFREALADKYHQYRVPSLEEVLERFRGLKREFPNVRDELYAHVEKYMTDWYKSYRRKLVGFSIYDALTVIGTPIILQTINEFKKVLEDYYILARKAFEKASKVSPRFQHAAFDTVWADTHFKQFSNHDKLKREEEVEEPLVTPVPKEMGTTNPLVRPDATETINPLARK